MNPRIEQAQQLKQIIESAEEILCVPHVNPDGDAIGASLGLTLLLQGLGKNVKTSWGSEIFIPAHYRFLPGIDMIIKPETIENPDCVIALDCGSRSRLGDLERCVLTAKCVVNIDHHAGNEMFGTVNIVEPDTSSTSELVYDLIRLMGYEMNKEVVECLYTGLVTDSGRFQYKNTTSETHMVAADMITRGIEPNYIYRRVYERATIGSIRLLCIMLHRALFLPDLSLIYSWILPDDLKQTDTHMAETENFVDYLRAVGEPEIAAILKQEAGSSIKASLRSKQSYDVGLLARHLGGGGHKHAAGYTSELSLEETIEKLKESIKEGIGKA